MGERPALTRGFARRSAPRFVRVSAACVLWLVFGFSPLAAQDINEAVTMEDLGFTERLAAGARAAGMAGAYTSAGDDAYALFYNPAGLARVRRIDFSIGFQSSVGDFNNVFYGNSGPTHFSTTTLDAVAAAYPVPTYRGSFVVAGGVQRMLSSELDLLNDGYNSATDTFDRYLLQQSGSAYSYAVGVGYDISPLISLGLTGFLMDGTINALTQFNVDYPSPLQTGDLETETLVDDAEVDLDGYGMVLGIQYHPHRLLHFGFAVTTPIPIDLEGGAIEQRGYYFFNDQDEFYEDQFIIDSQYTIPFRFDMGASFTLPNLVVDIDAGYSDWEQAKANDVRLKDENLQSVFRSVLDLRIGAELLVPNTPLRVRAGYALTPYALERLQADRITGADLQEADIDTERQTYAAGAGLLLNGVFMLDASYEYQTGKRSIPTLVDERTVQKVVVTGSYRF
jgi:opacity protein-like surface antigen